MEEKKVKEVKMKPIQGKAKEQQKLTYEQLNDACNQLFQQNQTLRREANSLKEALYYKRLEYLFKVVELANTIKDADFINSCIDEIKVAMTPAPEEENKKE